MIRVKHVSVIVFGLYMIFTSCGSTSPYNPYLGSKDDEKPSSVIAKEYKRGAKKGSKQYKKQLRRNKKDVYSK